MKEKYIIPFYQVLYYYNKGWGWGKRYYMLSIGKATFSIRHILYSCSQLRYTVIFFSPLFQETH